MKSHSSAITRLSKPRPADRRPARKSCLPLTEVMESRQLLSYTYTGSVTGLAIPTGQRQTSIVVTFNAPLVPSTAEDVNYYQVNAVGSGNPEFVTSTGKADRVVSAQYDASTDQVTLKLAQALNLNQFYRVEIESQPSVGVMEVSSGTTQPIDGDADQTPAGDFYGLVALGTNLRFTDSSGDKASIQLSNGGEIQVWRELDGDVDNLSVAGAVTTKSVISGSVKTGNGSNGQVVLASTDLGSVIDQLPSMEFVVQSTTGAIPAPVDATISSPTPVVATSKNLPYSLQIEKVSIPSVPTIQSADSAQLDGLWLVFGGRTNGLHVIDQSPPGEAAFPPQLQNNNIYVIDPSTGQTWTEAWTSTGLSQLEWAPLASADQEFYQQGDRLYTVGGYSSTGPSDSPTFQTYDTLSSISVSGLIKAVMTQGSVVSSVEQISNPRFTATGGDMDTIGNRTYLVFGQDFEGEYNNFGATGSQVYTDEVRSFRIIDNGSNLSVSDYKVQRDPVNFRRRDGSMTAIVFPNGKEGLEYLGGVFTVTTGSATSTGYLNPVVIGNDGTAKISSYQQYFSQYTAPNVTLFDSKTKSSDTILFGGISLYDYSFATGLLTPNADLPFVDDVTTLVQRSNGSAREYIMPSQLPGLDGTEPSYYGTEASYFAAPGLPAYSNGVVKLKDLKGPTTLGYIYGGIESTAQMTTDQSKQTTATNQVFKIVLTPN